MVKLRVPEASSLARVQILLRKSRARYWDGRHASGTLISQIKRYVTGGKGGQLPTGCEALNCGNKRANRYCYGTADIANISRDSSGPIVTDDLDFSDELLAINMTEEDHRQILEEIESL